MTRERLQQLQAAAKFIESDGVEGIKSATRIVGEDAANAILVAHLRINRGSMTSFPAPPGVEEATLGAMKELRLVS